MKTFHLVLGAALILAAGLCLTRKSPDEMEQVQNPVGAEVTRLQLQEQRHPTVTEEVTRAEPQSPASGDEPEANRAWLRAMAATDPKRAATWVEGLTDEARRTEATRDLALAWAELDSAAALAWVQGLPDTPRREQALETACLQIAQQDPVAALTAALVTSLPTEADGPRLYLIENLTAQWADRDVHAALEWARQIPNDNQRGAMLNRVALALVASDPLAAATLVATEFPAEGSAYQAAVSVVHQWAWRDAPSAAAWVSQFPDNPRFGEIVQNLIGVWGEKDAAAAEQWLATLPSAAAQASGQQALQEVRKRIEATAFLKDSSGVQEAAINH